MAEFTSNNYVSYGTSFVVPATGVIQPNPRFAYPNATNADGTQKRIDSVTATIPYGDHQDETAVRAHSCRGDQAAEGWAA